MKIAVFNVKFSPNLGDGLLSECLEYELRQNGDDVQAFSIDLAGRTQYGPGSTSRRLKLAILELLPGVLRRAVAGAALRRLTKKARPSWREALTGAQGVIIGGGNLFADSDLNFPIKIHAALDEASQQKLPVAVFGVGVSTGWSREGRRLFQDSLSQARLLSAHVRDDRSRRAWDDQLDVGKVQRAQVTTDPGLLSAFHYPRAAVPEGARRVGLCITDPLLLRYHGGSSSSSAMKNWFCELASALSDAGYEVMLFTNGSPEDQDFLNSARPDLSAAGQGRAKFVDPFHTPADLAHFISSCAIVLAHRMHACIAAYSYKIPCIGFEWDVKLRSFFELTERPSYIVPAPETSADDVCRLTQKAISESISPETHNRLVEICRADVRNLVQRFRVGSA